MPFSDYDEGAGSGPSQLGGVDRGDGPGGRPRRMPGETDEQYNQRFQAWNQKRQQYAANWDEAIGKQTGLAQEGYERAMSGQDSVAQQQLRQGQAEAGRMMAAQAVGRGSDPLAQRAAVYGGGELAGQAANQAAQLRAAETVAARGQYLGALSEQQQGIMGYDQMDLQKQIENARLRQQYQELALQRENADWEHGLAVAGMVTGGLAGGVGGAISDERLKMHVRPAGSGGGYNAIPSDERLKEKLAKAEGERDALERAMGDRQAADADAALAGARGYTYEYTPEARERYDLPNGRRYGPMAQNLAASGPIGASMVTETPHGDLAIDRDAALTGNLSMTARVNEKIEALKRELDAMKAGGV